ncbi:hypothetical protein LBMAG53_00970 [Planctomycetota bacterium]|nr:hypothetical protein LBMAG53_00970 [Planctomycetota bacterium]
MAGTTRNQRHPGAARPELAPDDSHPGAATVLGMLLAGLPLLLLPFCAMLLGYGRAEHVVTMPGRGAAGLMALIAIVGGLWLLITGGSARRRIMAWFHPAWFAALAVLWLLAWYLAGSPAPAAGLIRVSERGGALGMALIVSALLIGRIDSRIVIGLGAAGATILGCTVLADLPAEGGVLGDSLGIGRSTPFGLTNFAVGGAMPLLAAAVILAGLAVRNLFFPGRSGPDQVHQDGPLSRRLGSADQVVGPAWSVQQVTAAVAVFAVGVTASLCLALGLPSGDPARGAWIGLAAIGAVLVWTWLPARWHLPTALLGGLAVIIAQGALVYDPGLIRGAEGSTAQRLWFARCAVESASDPVSLLCGHGPATAIAVLPAQTSFGGAWLSVPSFPEHAHHEVLDVLVDGGLVLIGLLAVALVATLVPLWKRRRDPVCAGLLGAWAVAGGLSLIESHLSQPGPLFCLALLAGASWAAATRGDVAAPGPAIAAEAPSPSTAGPARWLGLLALAGGVWLAVVFAQDFRGGGPPQVRWVVAMGQVRRADQSNDPAAALATLDRLRADLGPLDTLDGMRAMYLGQLNRFDEAVAALILQVNRNPVDAGSLALLRRIRERASGVQAQALDAVLNKARAAAALSLAKAPNSRQESAKNAQQALRKELERPLPPAAQTAPPAQAAPPAPAQPPPAQAAPPAQPPPS